MRRRYSPAIEPMTLSCCSSGRREVLLKNIYFFFFLLHRYISTYLNVQERDPKAHRFLGQIYEAEDNIEKAFGCYKVSTVLMPNVLYSFLNGLLKSFCAGHSQTYMKTCSQKNCIIYAHLTMESIYSNASSLDVTCFSSMFLGCFFSFHS